MEAQFWLDKWKKQETGFHLEQIHPLLKKFYPDVFSPSKGVFVPLCGKTSDLTFFAEKGSYTLGCELSDIAVQAFFKEQKDTAQINQVGRFSCFRSTRFVNENNRQANIDILIGDIFDLNQALLTECASIYDRAALIALPESLRKDYVRQIRSLMTSAKMLLITLEYPQVEMDGPPFSVASDEVSELFQFAEVSRVYCQNILSKEPKFVARGLSYLNECAYVISW
ncbi:thiopurine S-methyltransferase [Aliikangiella coralliicola]|uniref:Thiopurine S-methyltransferase n=1 Tax=Aliikangiella coralliicola TaxID=2592383 RepID=A0A545TWK9_9GAMM|nr:thiopurine S-methyltransferase [Aliikangiella coralliicola]TQV81561.1 thiopurine S-methyltransferase [Aliikangiella coralliicola]